MNLDYGRIKDAIEFIHANVNRQPNLKEIALHVGLSEAHFQRMFSRWAGVTPKRYLQTITVEHAKKLLEEQRPVLDVSLSVGLSSTSRLHEHFVHLEVVTPGEYKTKGIGLEINYAVHITPFGKAFVAVTKHGICRLSFIKNDYTEELNALKNIWGNAIFNYSESKTQSTIEAVFNIEKRKDYPLSVLVTGTNFQINVWKALLALPFGSLSSYADIADKIGNKKSSRAVGTAIGKNPIAFLIPCHRVIQKSGRIGGYRWGKVRKHAIHSWEIAHIEKS